MEGDINVDSRVRLSLCVLFTHLLIFFSDYFVSGYFPRLLLLLPQVAVIAVILATYKYSSSFSDPSSTVQEEESVAWQANIQAIQNLMGF